MEKKQKKEPGMPINDEIDQEIYDVGAPLIDSRLMQKAKEQTHHGKTTVYDHTIAVTREALRICDHYRGQKELNRENVIIGALCHDMAMVGRYEKYRNNFITCIRHPKDSVIIAKEFFVDMDPAVKKIIRRHMWPLSLVPPTSVEEWIVLRADKVVSVKDVM